jgi:SAP domain
MTWKKPQMQDYLRMHDLPTSGNKDELLQRLIDNYHLYEFVEDDDTEEEEDSEDEDEYESDDDDISHLGSGMQNMGVGNRKALIVACSYW